MIFVDTSVWIQYFRGGNPKLTETLRNLLDQDEVALPAIVWLELLSGARQVELLRLKRVLSALPHYFPSQVTWVRIEAWIEKGINHGQRFNATDLLIASITVDHKGKLWSLDSDYVRMKKLGFLDCF